MDLKVTKTQIFVKKLPKMMIYWWILDALIPLIFLICIISKYLFFWRFGFQHFENPVKTQQNISNIQKTFYIFPNFWQKVSVICAKFWIEIKYQWHIKSKMNQLALVPKNLTILPCFGVSFTNSYYTQNNKNEKNERKYCALSFYQIFRMLVPNSSEKLII